MVNGSNQAGKGSFSSPAWLICVCRRQARGSTRTTFRFSGSRVFFTPGAAHSRPRLYFVFRVSPKLKKEVKGIDDTVCGKRRFGTARNQPTPTQRGQSILCFVFFSDLFFASLFFCSRMTFKTKVLLFAHTKNNGSPYSISHLTSMPGLASTTATGFSPQKASATATTATCKTASC